MTYHFGELIAHAARTRRLSAGTIVGSGTVSNADRSVGSACIAERRAIETIDDGSPTTQFLADGETVRMEVIDAAGSSVFGPIHQPVVVAA
jgi:fumarylacetoacetate (FAA) hydrolase